MNKNVTPLIKYLLLTILTISCCSVTKGIKNLNSVRFDLLVDHILTKYENLNIDTTWHKELYDDYKKATACSGQTNNQHSLFVLRECGMQEKHLDYMATEYAHLKDNTFISIFFHPVSNSPNLSLQIIEEYGTLVYTKTISFNRTGLDNLLHLIYEVHHCYGWLSAFDGIYARFKTLLNMPNLQNVLIVLWECASLEHAIECKRKIRRSHNDTHHTSCHFTDKHRETMYIAKSVFNQNTIDFLNSAHPGQHPTFIKLIKNLQAILQSNPPLWEHYCIDAGAVLAAHGLRDCGDLDLIVNLQQANSIRNVGINNVAREKYGFNIDDLLYNPDNFFYYKGLRFVKLDLVLSYKKKKANKKDLKDVKLIDNYFKRLLK